MKQLYLCIEHGVHFTVEAESFSEAKAIALGYGGEAIGAISELTLSE